MAVDMTLAISPGSQGDGQIPIVEAFIAQARHRPDAQIVRWHPLWEQPSAPVPVADPHVAPSSKTDDITPATLRAGSRAGAAAAPSEDLAT